MSDSERKEIAKAFEVSFLAVIPDPDGTEGSYVVKGANLDMIIEHVGLERFLTTCDVEAEDGSFGLFYADLGRLIR